MLTTAILAGFALMVLAPCVVALLGSRAEERLNTTYADRLVEEAVLTLPVRGDAAVARAAVAEAKESTKAAAKAEEKTAGVAKRPEERIEIADPVAPVRGLKSHEAVLVRAEIEVVRAKAISARAHAETMAAIARAAAAKAEAAAVEARLAEEAAARVVQEMRKAA